MVGDSQVVLTGGAENMSNSPYSLYNSRFGIKLGKDPVVRTIIIIKPFALRNHCSLKIQIEMSKLPPPPEVTSQAGAFQILVYRF